MENIDKNWINGKWQQLKRTETPNAMPFDLSTFDNITSELKKHQPMLTIADAVEQQLGSLLNNNFSIVQDKFKNYEDAKDFILGYMRFSKLLATALYCAYYGESKAEQILREELNPIPELGDYVMQHMKEAASLIKQDPTAHKMVKKYKIELTNQSNRPFLNEGVTTACDTFMIYSLLAEEVLNQQKQKIEISEIKIETRLDSSIKKVDVSIPIKECIDKNVIFTFVDWDTSEAKKTYDLMFSMFSGKNKMSSSIDVPNFLFLRNGPCLLRPVSIQLEEIMFYCYSDKIFYVRSIKDVKRTELFKGTEVDILEFLHKNEDLENNSPCYDPIFENEPNVISESLSARMHCNSVSMTMIKLMAVNLCSKESALFDIDFLKETQTQTLSRSLTKPETIFSSFDINMYDKLMKRGIQNREKQIIPLFSKHLPKVSHVSNSLYLESNVSLRHKEIIHNDVSHDLNLKAEKDIVISRNKELIFPLDTKVSEDNVSLYSEDNNKSIVIKKLKKGENIIVLKQLGEFNEWLKVKTQNEEGFVLKYDTELD